MNTLLFENRHGLHFIFDQLVDGNQQGIAKSKFEDIPGVGKKTVEKIYKRFKSTSEMKDLSDKALSYKLGVSQVIAKKIKKLS